MSAEAAQEAADNQASRTEQLRASTPSEGARASTPSEGASHGHGHGHGAAGSSESSSDGHAHGHDADGNCLEGGHSHGDGGTDSMAKTLGGGSGGGGHGHGHGGPPPGGGGQQPNMNPGGQMGVTSVISMCPDITKPMDGSEPVELTPQQEMQVEHMGRMMAAMVMTGVGRAFKMMHAGLSEEQQKVSTDAMERAQKESMMGTQTAQFEGQAMMERAMGEVLESLTTEQQTAWDGHIDQFIRSNVPDDTTQCYVLAGIKVREIELKLKALTTVRRRSPSRLAPRRC